MQGREVIAASSAAVEADAVFSSLALSKGGPGYQETQSQKVVIKEELPSLDVPC